MVYVFLVPSVAVTVIVTVLSPNFKFSSPVIQYLAPDDSTATDKSSLLAVEGTVKVYFVIDELKFGDNPS
ncbi:hypothetical protein D3C76_1309840 [compost metagenome]